MNPETIKKQAKEILDKFSKALEKVEIEEAKVERPEDRREEKEPEEKVSEEFRKIMFSNAPETKDDCIQGEKGEWTG